MVVFNNNLNLIIIKEFLKSLGENANDNDFHKKHGINYLKRFLERKYLEHIKECKPIVMKKIKEIKIVKK